MKKANPKAHSMIKALSRFVITAPKIKLLLYFRTIKLHLIRCTQGAISTNSHTSGLQRRSLKTITARKRNARLPRQCETPTWHTCPHLRFAAPSHAQSCWGRRESHPSRKQRPCARPSPPTSGALPPGAAAQRRALPLPLPGPPPPPGMPTAPGRARLRDGREGGRGGRRPQAAPPALRGRERSRTERHRPWVGARDGFPVRSHLFERSMRTPENSFSPSRNETTRASSMM